MKIYHYHPDYKYLVSDGVADPSPLDPPGVWLIPAYATEIEPPEYSEGFIPIFNENNWEIIEDKRGTYYSIINQEKIINYNPFEAPENSTKDVPPEVPNDKTLKWDDMWILEDTPELTPEEKLMNAGLTIEELKKLLGI